MLLHAAISTNSHLVQLPSSIDGVDQWDVLSDKRQVSERTEILHNIDPHANASALRIGCMKLLFASHGSTRHYNSWYPTPEGRQDKDGTMLDSPHVPYDRYMEDDLNIRVLHKSVNQHSSDGDSLQFTPHNSGRQHSDNVVLRSLYLNEMAHPQYSLVSGLLEKIGRKPAHRQQPLIVKCGSHPSVSCKPWLDVCLFNVTADPCEYENLASSRPHVVAAMKKRLQLYMQQAVRPLNKPVDDAGLPYHHNWNWVPWI